MVSQGRAQRIGQRIQRELSELLLFEITDPRLQDVFITSVRVDREISFASVFVSALEGIERKDEILAGMKSASGYMRRHLANRIQLRTFPQLRFNWDSAPEHVGRIEELISSLHDDSSSHDDPSSEIERPEEEDGEHDES